VGKKIRVTGYFSGILLVLIGIVLIAEFMLELSSEIKAPYVTSYLLIGTIFIIIGGVICYITDRNSKKSISVENKDNNIK
jgi:lipopolysaccharide export LptBFGC system permease protein LptF